MLWMTAGLLMLLTGLGVLAWYVVAAPGSQIACRTLAAGPRTESAVALTFDDGPGEDTPRILDILRDHGVRATFFLCGENVERFPEIVRRIASEGHAIGSHAYSHRSFLWRTPGWMAHEIERAQRVIRHHIPEATFGNSSADQPQWFRPPYGHRWFGLSAVLKRYELRAVMWDVNPKDWKHTAAEIARQVLSRAQPGSIILLHDGIPPREATPRQSTVDALPRILAGLKDRFQLVTIPELDRLPR